MTKKRCGLCGKSGKLTRTECCGNWICDDADSYVAFSYARNSCYHNHVSKTLCAFHHNEQHPGDWRTCAECRDQFDTENYVFFGTNEYNFDKLENPPEYEPTCCDNCGVEIRLGYEGYTKGPDGIHCADCAGDQLRERARELIDRQRNRKKKARKKAGKKARIDVKSAKPKERPALIADMRHFLDDNRIPDDLPDAALNTALFLGSIAAWITARWATEPEVTNVMCRKRPNRRRCRGAIVASYDAGDDGIFWQCPFCEDRGFIHGWEDTPWDRRDPEVRRNATSRGEAASDPAGGPRRPVPLESPVFGDHGEASSGFTPQARTRWEALDVLLRTRILNNVFCSTCLGNATIVGYHGRIERGDLVLVGSCGKCGGEVARVIEGA